MKIKVDSIKRYFVDFLKNFFPKIILLVVSITICLLAWEGYFRIFEPELPKGTVAAFQSLYPDSSNSILALKPNYKGKFQAKNFDVTIETDERGFRLPSPVNLDNIDVLVMGDSFTFGHGIEGNERYGYLFGEMSGLKTLVTSYANGWATPHYYKYFLLNENFKPEHIIVGLFLGNDLYRDMNSTVILQADPFDMAVPFSKVERNGMLRNVKKLRYDFMNYLRKNSIFFRKLLNYFISVKGWTFLLSDMQLDNNYYNPKTLESGESIPQAELAMDFLLRLKNECQRRNTDCKLHTMIIPFHVLKNFKKPNEESTVTFTLDACEKRKLDCFNLFPILRREVENGTKMYFEHDGHWTATANLVVANSLCKNLKGITCKP